MDAFFPVGIDARIQFFVAIDAVFCSKGFTGQCFGNYLKSPAPEANAKNYKKYYNHIGVSHENKELSCFAHLFGLFLRILHLADKFHLFQHFRAVRSPF